MKRQQALGVLDLILGILLFLAGIYAMANPLTALSRIPIFYGILAVITGMVDIVFYVKLERRTGFGPVAALVSGIFSILTGILLLARPVAGSVSLAILFPIWFLAHCISELSRLPQIRWFAGRGVYFCTLVLNIIGLILGVALLFSPLLSMFALPWVTGLYLLLLGINSILFGVRNLTARR